MVKIEHIGVAVNNIEEARSVFTKLFGKTYFKSENVASENVAITFFQMGETKIELLNTTSGQSAISKFIEKKGEGIHHIAFSVDDIHSEIKRLKNEGFLFISEEPKPGADNKLICFIHPKSTNGVLVELCQDLI